MSTAEIHARLRALGLSAEDDRRALYVRVTGKCGLREMTPRERAAVLDELRRLDPRVRAAGPADRVSGPFAAKLRALWIAGWNLALVRDASDRALMDFVRRQTGLDHPRWLTDPILAEKAIEALKAWIARDGGVEWTPPRGTSRGLCDPRARVAFAQWRRIGAPSTFQAALRQILGPDVVLQPLELSPADWQVVMNALGRRLRGEAS